MLAVFDRDRVDKSVMSGKEMRLQDLLAEFLFGRPLTEDVELLQGLEMLRLQFVQ
jgi:hypothetical protein